MPQRFASIFVNALPEHNPQGTGNWILFLIVVTCQCVKVKDKEGERGGVEIQRGKERRRGWNRDRERWYVIS